MRRPPGFPAQELARALLLAMLLAARPAFAYRPFDGTDAAVAGPRELEFELGPVGYLDRAGDHLLIAPRAVLNFGLRSAWEVVLEGSRAVPIGGAPGAARTRLIDTALSAKHVARAGALQGRDGASVAIEGGLLLPTANDESGVGGSVAAIVSRRARALTLHLNAEAILERSRDLDGTAGLVLEGPELGRVRPVGEVTLASDPDPETRWSALAGVIWRPADDLAFDFALREAGTGVGSAHEVRAGLTWSSRY